MNKIIKKQFFFKMNKSAKEILIGMLLGDGHIRRSGADNAYIAYEQSLKKKEYFNYVKDSLEKEGLPLSDNQLYSRFYPRRSSTTESVRFSSKAIPELKELADMFLDEDGKKKIPSNIGTELTPKALAQ